MARTNHLYLVEHTLDREGQPVDRLTWCAMSTQAPRERIANALLRANARLMGA